jgi:hypothetical protein
MVRIRLMMAALSASSLVGCCLGCLPPQPPPLPVRTTCDLTDQRWAEIEGNSHSVARVWNELALQAIRLDLPQPTVHARNLFHLSTVMYDAWASRDATAQGVYFKEKFAPTSDTASESARAETIAYAAHRLLSARYNISNNLAALDCFEIGFKRAGFDVNNIGTSGDTPAAIGNRIGQTVLDATRDDGSNETNAYKDTTGFKSVNPFLQPQIPGVGMVDPNQWQALLLEVSFSQNGIQTANEQKFVGAGWREVRPFAMKRSGRLYHDPGPAPTALSGEMKTKWIPDLLRKQSELDFNSSVTFDASPGKLGNNSLGSNDGVGHTLNPITGATYAPQIVKKSDYWRVVAEFWADGPSSETPPGHWNVLANKVSDSSNFKRQIGGAGRELSRLEWDLKTYLALNGALHDAAITAWEIKRDTITARPISLVRYLAMTNNLPEIPGLIEQRNGKFQIRSWHPFSSADSNINWADADTWVPYQLPTFVTPAFPGFVSGHSTFSRAAAEVMTDLTGSAFFPAGLLEVVVPPGSLKIDSNQNNEVRLQWATYYDAADQAGQSRIWGGIHIEPDDLTGRKLGKQIGLDAVALARKYFTGIAP